MSSPTVRSRRLAQILRDYRKAAGLQQKEVARYIGHTVQWVCRVENASTCRASVGDVRALLALYGVTDPAEVRRIAAIAADARLQGWWHEYDLSAKHATFIALEAEAAEKLVWEPSLIPGLLQTEPYSRAVICSGPDWLDAGQEDKLVRVRSERQKILRREDPLRLTAILDEAVLHRPVGNKALMREQLRHLTETAHLSSVTVRVLPSSAGAHPGMTGPFAILRYPDPGDHDILYCETPAGGIYAEEPHDTERAHRAFSRLGMLALSCRDTIALVARVAADL